MLEHHDDKESIPPKNIWVVSIPITSNEPKLYIYRQVNTLSIIL